MAIIIAAAILLTGLPCWITSRDLSRCSANTVGGIIFITSATPRGINTRSSKYPRKGTKSGIKSIGLNAYPTTPNLDHTRRASESLSDAQRFALLAGGRAWTMLIIVGNAEAREMLENAAESPASSARGVGQAWVALRAFLF